MGRREKTCCSSLCTKIYFQREPSERFWEKVNKTETCWIWTGAKDKDGYGRLRFGKTHIKAHRYSWELEHGPIPEGMQIHHIVCNNPPCVRPSHLEIGDAQKNIIDCIEQERFTPCKLTAKDIQTIRADARSCAQIAREYGVVEPTIGKIKRRKLWNHVE